PSLLLSLLHPHSRSSHSFPTRRSSDLTTYADLQAALRKSPVGTPIPLTYVRDGATATTSVTLVATQRPAPGTDPGPGAATVATPDRKSTRLNSSHVKISYAVFCLKKKR